MKKRLIIPTALAGILGGVVLMQQTEIFSSAQQVELLSATEAKTLALKEFNGEIVEFDFDRDDAPHYEFDIVSNTEKAEVIVDAQSGAVLIKERETIAAPSNAISDATAAVEKNVETAVATAQMKVEDAVQQVIPAPKVEVQPKEEHTQQTAPLLTKAQAIAIAQAKAAGTVVDVDYDDDDLEYEIEIKNGTTEYELSIDARTGTITKFDKDTEDD